MRVAVTADPELPVPPRLYGGIERIVDLLVRGLLERGHEVTLFAHPDSVTDAKLIRYPGSLSNKWYDTSRNTALVARNLFGGGHDIVHSFSRLVYLLPILALSLPKLMTYQREVTHRSIIFGNKLSRGTLHFSAVSNHMMTPVADAGNWHVVYNGVDTEIYDFERSVAPDAPLVFLGRIEHIKGAHLAIEVARRAKLKLVIAGNVAAEHESYFNEQIRPWIDGETITYIGAVDDRQKNQLLGSARAFLMPILWEEPFGIVMAEALACGTPVVGLARGAVPEVVDDGVTGFVCQDVDGLVHAVGRLKSIDRAACRLAAEQRFSADAVVEGYLAVYRKMCKDFSGVVP